MYKVYIYRLYLLTQETQNKNNTIMQFNTKIKALETQLKYNKKGLITS